MSHGSCVLSKAIGLTNGVYKNTKNLQDKNSRVVVLKVAVRRNTAEMIWAFDAILADMRGDPNPQGAVIIFSLLSNQNFVPADHEPIRQTMLKIFNLGGVITVPSGNNADRGRPYVDAVPALWESPTFPLIVVGAVGVTYQRASFSQWPNHVTIYAPGDQIQCAMRHGTRITQGTSHANGMV